MGESLWLESWEHGERYCDAQGPDIPLLRPLEIPHGMGDSVVPSMCEVALEVDLDAGVQVIEHLQ